MRSMGTKGDFFLCREAKSSYIILQEVSEDECTDWIDPYVCFWFYAMVSVPCVRRRRSTDGRNMEDDGGKNRQKNVTNAKIICILCFFSMLQ